MADLAVRVEGYTDFYRGLKRSESVILDGFRDALKEAAEPVRLDAERLALLEIPRMRLSPQWALMRTGVTQRFVYIVPRARGTRRRLDKRRNLRVKMQTEAMNPALEANIQEVDRAVDMLMVKGVKAFGS